MKNNFDRTKTATARFSTRTVAMVLSIVMLIGSIATGSMLSTFAAYMNDAALADAVAQAATKGSNIALNAISSEDATVDNAESKPDLSGLEENEIVRGMKNDLAQTAANNDLAQTGEDTTYYLFISTNQSPGEWKNYVTSTDQSFTFTASQAGLASFETGKNYYVGISSSDKIANMWSQTSNNSAAIGTKDSNISSASSQSFNYNNTTYNFAMFSLSKVVDSVTVSAALTTKDNKDITNYSFSTGSAADTGWYLRMGEHWTDNYDDYKFTYNATSGYYEKTVNWSGENYFRVANGSNQYSGNSSTTVDHVITASDSFSNLVGNSKKSFYFVADSTAKDYLIQIDNGSKKIRIKEVSTYTFSLPTVEHAVVKATYNGTTINEGGTLTDLPSNANITINVTPDSLYTCDNMSCSVTGSNISPSGAATKYTFTMPAANVSASDISFTLTDQSSTVKKVYFNNYYTKYENVFAYAKTPAGLEPLGPWAGTGMTKLANTNTYSIEVPGTVTTIYFIGYINPDSYSTGELTIPWSDTPDLDPKYTPTSLTNPATGTWGDYVPRTNEYTVSDGDTIKNKPNIYTGITATFYDYYVDGEVGKRWIQDIENDQYTWSNYGNDRNPYEILNNALDAYSRNNQVTYPLYFGDLNTKVDGNLSTNPRTNNISQKDVSYYNWNVNANNAAYLNPYGKAVTGLSGKTLDDANIHYYKASGTKENGAAMAMFDEDFLSGENFEKQTLATILRSPSFPVRKGEKTYLNKMYVDTNGKWNPGTADLNTYKFFAHFYDSGNPSDFQDLPFTHTSGNDFSIDIPQGYDKVVIAVLPNNSTTLDWNNKIAQTDDLDVPTEKSKAKFTVSGDVSNSKLNGSWGALDTASTSSVTYYEFNSTDGYDNAYIQNISTSEKTATIEYYNNPDASSATNKVKSAANSYGFFPFDRNELRSSMACDGGTDSTGYAKDLGFGMKLEIPFTLDANGKFNGTDIPQTFDFSGDDDLWVFIDDQLVLDLGGAHSRTEGTIDFAECKITGTTTQIADNSSATRNAKFGKSDGGFFDNSNPNTIHTMTLYYMERGMDQSNLKFGFSFHAIPNLLRTEKKVRTNGANGSTRINSGFFTANSNDTNIGTSGKTLFEESFNHDTFSFLQEYSTDGGTTYTTASGKVYTIGSESTNYTVGTEGKYDMVNDRVVNFLDQFGKNSYIRLTETPQTDDYYTYDQKLLLFDDAVSTTVPLADSYITKTSDGAVDHYSFQFRESAPSSSALDNLRLRARFENMMRAHTLTLRKAITGTDDNEPFTIKVLFQFPGSNDFIVYPAYYKKFDKNGNEINGNLDKTTGAVTLAANEYIELSGIPENTMIKVVEDLSSNTSYNYIRTTVLEESGDTVTAEDLTGGDKGVTFTMYDEDQTATVYNSKQLILTHTLHPNNRPDDGSMASTYISYRILDSNDTEVYTSGEVKNGPLTVDGKYLVSGSSNRLEVTLRTALADFINFKEYTVQDGVTYSGDDYFMIDGSSGHRGLYSSTSTKNHNAESTEYTLTNTYAISQLLEGGKLKTNTLDYFSEVEKPQFKYEITYKYPAYVRDYGTQSYTYTGTFTDYELNKYMEYRNLIIDRKDKTAGSDTETFFKTLVSNNAPYEKNFRTVYDFSTANIEHLQSTASSGVYKMTVNVNADPTKVTATFVLPYAIQNGTYCVPVDSDGKVYKAQSGDLTSQSYTVYSHDWVNTKGKRNPKDDSTTVEPEFIRPALIYYDGSTAYYFQYWSVATESAYKSAAKEYTRCYDSSFNLTIFQNCTVTPVYSTTPWEMPGAPTAWDMYERFDPDVMHNKDTMGQQDPVAEGLSNEITVAFMENSRNQYNHNGGGTISDARKGAGDRIYSDFLLSYNNIAGNQQLNLLAAGSKKVGLVIQPVGKVTPAEGTKTEADYAGEHGSYLSADDYNALKTYLSGGGLTGGYQFASAQFDASELDNKNRIQYYFGINNKSFVAYDPTNLPELLDSYANNHYKVFRAYAYIVDCDNGTPDWDTLKVNNAATYFTIYDIGSIQNGSKAD